MPVRLEDSRGLKGRHAALRQVYKNTHTCTAQEASGEGLVSDCYPSISLRQYEPGFQ